MRIPLSSVSIGLILLSTVVVPSLVRMVFHTSSMAAGVTFILGLHIILLVVLNSIRRQSNGLGVGAIFILIVMGIVMIQSAISLLTHDDFDFGRFEKSYQFLFFYFFGAFSFASLAQKIPNFQVDYSARLVFYVLLLSCVSAILHFQPFPSAGEKSVFFFNEPSHFALGFLPFLLYMVVTSSPRKRLLLVLLGYSIALLLESLTLIVGCTIVAALTIPLKRLLFLAPFAVILILYTGADLAYYSSRMSISDFSQNLSTLVFLSGWERASLNFEETFGLGVGFQQFGIIGSRGLMLELMGPLGADNLNLLDGGAVAPKFIGEFGLLGVVMILVYLVYFTKGVRWLREVSMSKIVTREYKRVFFLSCFVMYSMDLFVRGAGYFSPSGYIFIASLMWIALTKTSNYFRPNMPVATRSVT
jgi:hypothetical protein